MVRPRIWLCCRSRVHFPLCFSVMAWLARSFRCERANSPRPYRPGGSFLVWAAIRPSPGSLFPRKLARPPHGVSFLSCRLLRWLFIEALASYLPEHSFALHLPSSSSGCEVPDRRCLGQIPASVLLLCGGRRTKSFENVSYDVFRGRRLIGREPG